MTKVEPPPVLTVKNSFEALEEEDEEDDEFELPEACGRCGVGVCGGWEELMPRQLVTENKKKAENLNRKQREKVVEAKRGDNGHAMTLTSEPLQEVHALSGTSWMHIDPATKWRRVRSVMDSGASDNCGPPELAPEVPIEESPGSKRGQRYAAAGGKTIENLGQKMVQMKTDLGQDVVGTWQMAEVVRPLNSVKKICEKGNRVIFGSEGGVIQNLYTGEEIPFGVEGDIYTLDLWLPPVEDGEKTNLGFTRLGPGR